MSKIKTKNCRVEGGTVRLGAQWESPFVEVYDIYQWHILVARVEFSVLRRYRAVNTHFCVLSDEKRKN